MRAKFLSNHIAGVATYAGKFYQTPRTVKTTPFPQCLDQRTAKPPVKPILNHFTTDPSVITNTPTYDDWVSNSYNDHFTTEDRQHYIRDLVKQTDDITPFDDKHGLYALRYNSPQDAVRDVDPHTFIHMMQNFNSSVNSLDQRLSNFQQNNVTQKPSSSPQKFPQQPCFKEAVKPGVCKVKDCAYSHDPYILAAYKKSTLYQQKFHNLQALLLDSVDPAGDTLNPKGGEDQDAHHEVPLEQQQQQGPDDMEYDKLLHIFDQADPQQQQDLMAQLRNLVNDKAASLTVRQGQFSTTGRQRY